MRAQQRGRGKKQQQISFAFVCLPTINPPKEDFYLFFALGTNKLIVCKLTKRKKHTSAGTTTTTKYGIRATITTAFRKHTHTHTYNVCRSQKECQQLANATKINTHTHIDMFIYAYIHMYVCACAQNSWINSVQGECRKVTSKYIFCYTARQITTTMRAAKQNTKKREKPQWRHRKYIHMYTCMYVFN